MVPPVAPNEPVVLPTLQKYCISLGSAPLPAAAV